MTKHDISCHICSELYQSDGPHEPRILHCGHTMCLKCLTFLVCSSLTNSCPFCKSSFNDRKVNFPKNYALIDVLDDSSHSKEKKHSFNLTEIERLKEQAQSVCFQERLTILKCTEMTNQLDCLKLQTEGEVMQVELIRGQANSRFLKSQKRLQKYEYILSLLESIDSTKQAGSFRLNHKFSTTLGQQVNVEHHHDYDTCPVSKRPNLQFLMKQIRFELNYSHLISILEIFTAQLISQNILFLFLS